MEIRPTRIATQRDGESIDRSWRLLNNSSEVSLLHISACPHPFKAERIDYKLPTGLTITEIVETIQIDPLLREYGVVFLDDMMVPTDRWHLVRPKPGIIVSIRMLPRGGGGFMRILATVAITALAITAMATLGPAGPFVAMGITIGGGLLMNLLLPPPVPKISKHYGNDPVTYSITNQRNQARPWEKVPFLCGRFKLTPAYAALPYREVVGGEIYWRAIFAVAHGPIHWDSLSIGQTDINEFQGIEFELRRGYWETPFRGNWNPRSGVFPANPQFGDTFAIAATGSIGGITYYQNNQITYNGVSGPNSIHSWDSNQAFPFSLFPSDVFEDSLTSAIKYQIPVIRTTQQNADEIGIELIFERGIVHIQNSPPGKRSDRVMTVLIQQAPTGTEQWANVIQTDITGRQTTPLYWGHRWRSTDIGVQDANRQYDIRVWNLTGDQDEDRNFGNFTWYALRTFTMQNPVPVPGVGMVAMRIKASGQLSGSLDEFNCVAWSMCKDWDKATQSWVWRPTASPAAHYRHILQHPSRQVPSTDSQIDLAKLQYWDDIIRSNNRFFNGVFDSKGSLYDTLVDVCRVGRAVPSLREMRYSVIIDEPKTVPVRMFTPFNSWDYHGEMSYQGVPNAYRIGYVNKEKDFATQEVLVYDDGYDASNAIRVDLVQWVGIDNNNQAWKEGRFFLAQQRLRREIHRITTDFEYLCCERGDLVALQYDTISVGSGTAHIISVTESGAAVVAITIDNAVTMEAGKTYNVRVRRVVNNAQRTNSYVVVTNPGEQTTLQLSSPVQIYDAPDVGDIVAFGETGRETLRAIVRDIEPKNDLSAIITLISEAPGIHVAEFGPIPPWDPTVTKPFSLPAPLVLSIISDFRVMFLTASRTLIDRVVFALQPIAIDGVYLRVTYKLMGTSGQWQQATIQDETVSSISVMGPTAGESYDFRLQYIHPSFLGSPITSINSYYVVGCTDAPDDLKNLTLGVISGQALLRWNLSENLDVQFGGYIMFRHTPLIENAFWPNTTSLAQAVVGDQTHVFLPLKSGTYFGRVYDADGRSSLNAIGISTKQASILAFSPVSEVQEDPTFSGTKSGCTIISEGLTLTLGDFDSVENVDAMTSWDIASGVTPIGTYTFAAGIDLGAIKKVRVISHIEMAAVNEFAFWDDRTGNIDDWLDVDNTTGASVDAQIYGKMTDDDPAASPIWGTATRIDSLEINNRAIGRLECKLISNDPVFNIVVSQLRISTSEINISPTTIDYILDAGGPSS